MLAVDQRAVIRAVSGSRRVAGTAIRMPSPATRRIYRTVPKMHQRHTAIYDQLPPTADRLDFPRAQLQRRRIHARLRAKKRQRRGVCQIERRVISPLARPRQPHLTKIGQIHAPDSLVVFKRPFVHIGKRFFVHNRRQVQEKIRQSLRLRVQHTPSNIRRRKHAFICPGFLRHPKQRCASRLCCQTHPLGTFLTCQPMRRDLLHRRVRHAHGCDTLRGKRRQRVAPKRIQARHRHKRLSGKPNRHLVNPIGRTAGLFKLRANACLIDHAVRRLRRPSYGLCRVCSIRHMRARRLSFLYI